MLGIIFSAGRGQPECVRVIVCVSVRLLSCVFAHRFCGRNIFGILVSTVLQSDVGDGGRRRRLQRLCYEMAVCTFVAECVFMCVLLTSAAVSIETRVQIQESVRGKDVFIIQTVSK